MVVCVCRDMPFEAGPSEKALGSARARAPWFELIFLLGGVLACVCACLVVRARTLAGGGGRERVEDTTAECSGKQDGDGPESKSGDECKDGGLRGSAETFIPGSINGGTMLQRDGIVAMQPHEVGCGAKVTRRAEKILPSVLQQALTCISTGPSCRVH